MGSTATRTKPRKSAAKPAAKPAAKKRSAPRKSTRERDLERELEATRAQLAAQADAPDAGHASGPAAPPPPASVDAPGDLPDYAGEWPQLGGFGDAPQPWDLRAQGLRVSTDAEGRTTIVGEGGQVTELPAGAPNTVSPIVVAHGRPTISMLSTGDPVRELAELLALLGYETSISRGTNALAVFDESVAAAVDSFKRDYDVEEDPSGFPRDSKDSVQRFVSSWTWEGLLRAARRARESATDPRLQTFAR
jgi:hypothetical protein